MYDLQLLPNAQESLLWLQSTCLQSKVQLERHILRHGFLMATPLQHMQREYRLGMSQSKVDGCQLDLLFPSHYWMNMEHPHEKEAWRSFSERKRVPAVWRGSTTGFTGENVDGWVVSHRVRLAILAAESEIVDAKVYQVLQSGDSGDYLRTYLLQHDAMGPSLEDTGALDHQMVLDVDGNSWSSRLPKLLWSDALVLRASTFANFMDGYMLKAYEHYIPVRLDFSDLEDKIRWALANPDEVRRIRANVRRDFPPTQEALYEYMVCYGQQLLLEYACLVYDHCECE